ncbi:bifunctional DNA primase/polymerase [Aestuariivirga sp.]|uniref:bifunctional DNA primase/polymerase n=1 Tax=Aestuariivirga sp. TaxID=2650926 RepID=UPI0035944958
MAAALLLASRGVKLVRAAYKRPDATCSCGLPPLPDDPAMRVRGKKYCRGTGKHPIGRWGYDEFATTDANAIRAWFKDDPESNYGPVAGPHKFILDIDEGETGIKTACDLLDVSKANLLSMTFTVRTPKGGYHLYFESDAIYSNSVRTALGPGLDTRSGNGFAVGPGCKTYLPDEFEPDTLEPAFYSITHDAPFAPLPEVIKAKMNLAKHRPENGHLSIDPDGVDSDDAFAMGREMLKTREPAYEGNGGDFHTYVTCCKLKDFNLSKAAIFEMLVADGGWNERCEPPWYPEDLELKIDRAFKYGKERPGSKNTGLMRRAEDGEHDEPEADNDNDEFDAPKSRKPNPMSIKDRLRSSLLTSTEYAARIQDYEFAVDQFVPASSYTIVLGKRGSGKTIVVMDLLKSLATDQKTWMGEEMDAGWYVVGIVLEDKPGVKMRDEAWHKAHPEAQIDPARFKLLDYDLQGFKAETEDEIEALMEVMREDIEAHMAAAKVQGARKLVIWITTWQRFVALADKGMSDDAAMARGAAYLESFAAKFRTGPDDRCFTIIEAHPPKANEETTFGSGIIENMSGTVIHISTAEDKKTRTAKLVRSKAAEEDQNFVFTTDSIELDGKDRFGKSRTGAVACHVPSKGRQKVQRAVSVTKDTARRARFIDLLVSLYEESPDQTTFTASETAKAWLEMNKAIADDRKAPAEVRAAAKAETGKKGKSVPTLIKDLARLFKGSGNVVHIKSGKVVTFNVSPGAQGVFEIREPAIDRLEAAENAA